jgi:Putative transposase
MIVTGGGVSPDGPRWIASRPDYLVPVEVLSALFRGRMLGMPSNAHAAGRPKRLLLRVRRWRPLY